MAMKPKKLSIDIGVCTFRRPELADTLRSLAAMEMPARFDISVIVADNDETPSAQALVTALSRELALPVRYRHAPARNISIARNACLDASEADFLAFIDDYETAYAPLACRAGRDGASEGRCAVLGPVRARPSPGCADDAPRHLRLAVWVRGDHNRLHLQSCSGWHRNSLRPPLQPGAARAGGEAPVLSTRCTRPAVKSPFRLRPVGGRVVPPRAAFDWPAAVVSASANAARASSGTAAGIVVKQVGLASAKAIFCFASALPVVVSPVRRNRSVLRGIMHVGVVSGLVGIREIRLYGQSSPQEGGKRAA